MRHTANSTKASTTASEGKEASKAIKRLVSYHYQKSAAFKAALLGQLEALKGRQEHES